MRPCLWIGLAILVCLNVDCQWLKSRRLEAEKRELEERAMKEKCKRDEQWFFHINRNAEEFGPPPQATKLTDKPYVKGKIVVLKRFLNLDKEYHGIGLFLLEDCKRFRDSYAGQQYGNEDELHDVRARSSQEVQTIVYLDCENTVAGHYVREGEVPAPFPESELGTVSGFEESCTMYLVDRTIPAIIYKKDFHSRRLQSV